MNSTQTKSAKPQIQKDENQMGQMLAGYLAYWPIFLIFLLLSFGSAFVYLRYATPKYSASATLIIKDEKKGSEDSKMMESIDAINTKKIIENEIEVLQSRILINDVIRKLNLYAPVWQKGKVRSQSAYVLSPLNVEAKSPDSLKSFSEILMEYDKNKGTVKLTNGYDLSGKDKIELNVSSSGPIDEWLKTPYGELKFVKNPYYYESTEEKKPFFFNLTATKNMTDVITLGLKVAASSKLSSVVDLDYTDEVPRKAEDILNTLIFYYNEEAIIEKGNLVKNTLISIEERLSVVAADLDSIERKMQQFKSGNSAVELGVQGNLYLQGVNATDTKLGEVSVQLSNLNQLEQFVSSKESNIGILPSAIGVSDPALTQLMTNLNTAQMEYERQKKTVGENNPIMLSLKEQIEKIKPNILSNIQTQKKNLQVSRNNLYANTGKYSSMLNYLPQKERQLLEISRDQQIKSNIYQFLLQKREESKLSYAATLSDSKVVNYAQAGRQPVSPKSMIIYIAAIFMGLIIPAVIVNGKELLSNKVLYRKEIEALTSLPIIGEVVFNNSKQQLVLEAGKRSFIAEEFRKIRISLLFLGIDANHKKMVVTSSIPGEGKTFVAANLAVSLAMTGKKVALVDMDLHDPSLGKLFDITSSEAGVSNYLTGENEIHEIIREIPSQNNLFFLSSGAIQESPSELLENGKIQQLISYLEENFDVVILDTAPVVMVTDAYLLSSLCDATLYVVRHKYTPKMLVKRIDEVNKINSLKNAAIIFNGIKTRGFVKNNYGYGYDYVYGGDKKSKKSKKVKA